jgi:hypothetical protein
MVRPPVVAVAEPPAEPLAPVAPPHRHIIRARHRVATPPRETASNGATLIRIETPDPDVVILLVGG